MHNKHEDKVLRLKKSLYGLKEATIIWNNHIKKYFQENKFVNKYALHDKIYVNEDFLLIYLMWIILFSLTTIQACLKN